MRIPRRVVRAIARTKPLVPEKAWPFLLTTRSLFNGGPVIGLPSCRRALVLAPHPDDETIGCGGTIALLRRAGATVNVVFVSSGESTIGGAASSSEVATLRRTEAKSACEALGGTELTFLDYPDGAVGEHVDRLADEISDLVAAERPDVVFLPWFLDGHPDHAAVARAAGAAGLPETIELWGYEIWAPVPANRLVDISEVIEAKREAIAAHATAHRTFDVEAMLGLSRYRSLDGLMGRGHAEAFIAGTPSQWAALSEAGRIAVESWRSSLAADGLRGDPSLPS